MIRSNSEADSHDLFPTNWIAPSSEDVLMRLGVSAEGLVGLREAERILPHQRLLSL